MIRVVPPGGVADQHDARGDWPLDPMVLVRVGVEWSDRLALGDPLAQRQTFQPKSGEQVLRSPSTGKPFASVEIVADIEPELRAPLRKDEIVDAALGPQCNEILRPFRHTVDKHSANQIVRLVAAHGEAQLALDCGVASVGADDQTGSPGNALAIVLERYGGRFAGGNRDMSDPAQHHRSHPCGSGAEGGLQAMRWPLCSNVQARLCFVLAYGAASEAACTVSKSWR